MKSKKSFTKDFALMTIATVGFFCVTSYSSENAMAFSSRPHGPMTKDSWKVQGPINSIKISSTSGELNVTPSSDGNLSIEAKGRLPIDAEKDARILKISQEGSEVSIVDEKEINDLSIEVKIPQGLESIGLRGTSGGATIKDLKATGFTFNSVSGSLDAKNVEFNIVTAKSVSGEIEATFVKIPMGNFESVSGDVELKLPPAQKVKFTLKTLSGDIKNSYPSSEGANDEIAVKTTSGDIEIK